MKEYNVILKKDVDYDSFWEDMETETEGLIYIPNRRIDYTNERPGSLRQCWYLLTEEEVELVKQDPRVLDVEIPPEHRDDIIMLRNAHQRGDYTKTTSDSGNYLNWGLIRGLYDFNLYGTDTATTASYTYSLTGEGVDVVIQDSGIQIDHPEFQDELGQSRFVSVDWGAIHGGFSQSANHDRDYDGHGTHCAGIAAGKNYGWAKKARIHHQKLNGLEGSGDSGTGINITYAFDAIKLWHAAKPVDPKTGVKRPTVINMSWGYGTFFNTVSSLNYRGVSYTDASTTGNATYRANTYGLINNSGAGAGYNYVCNTRISSVDTDIEELIDAGAIVCIAAGNRGCKIDVSGGTDYDNYVVTDTGTKYYHRGSSPYSDRAIMVGNIDSTVYDASTDQKATSSETGPGVDIYAPGTNIMSCTSTTNKWGSGSQNYYWNTSYRQTNISGTSMASPQVVGMVALLLEMNPAATPSVIKNTLEQQSSGDIYVTLNNNDWTDRRSLLGGVPRMMYNKFGRSQALQVTGGVTISAGLKTF